MKVGLPLQEAMERLLMTIDTKNWEQFNKPAVASFIQREIFRIPGLLDPALSNDDLENFDSKEVIVLALLLCKDFFKHASKIIRPEESTNDWVDLLFAEIAESFDLQDRIVNSSPLYDINEDLNEAPKWAVLLSEPFGEKFSPLKLFSLHMAIVTGIKEEFPPHQSSRCTLN